MAEMIAGRHRVSLLVPGHGACASDIGEIRRRLRRDRAYIARLRALVRSGDEAAIDAMLEGWAYPRNLRECHRRNAERIRRELGR